MARAAFRLTFTTLVHSIIFAWKEIIRHWNILWNISRLNHHHYKLPYMGISSGMEMLRQNREHMKLISLT